MQISENYRGQRMDVNASYDVGGAHVHGFLAKTDGTISITDKGYDLTNMANSVTVDAVPVKAGSYTPIPLFATSPAGFTVKLDGGASGTLFI